MLKIIQTGQKTWPVLAALAIIVVVGIASTQVLDWVAPVGAQEGDNNNEAGVYATSLRASGSEGLITLTWQPPASVPADGSIEYIISRHAGDQSHVLGTIPTTIYRDNPGANYHCQDITYVVVTSLNGVEQSPSISAVVREYNPEDIECVAEEEEVVAEVAEPEPPSHVLCFYTEGDVIKSVRVLDCSVTYVHKAWYETNGLPDPTAVEAPAVVPTSRGK